MANAPLSPRIQFVDAKGYLTRDAILLLQSLQDSTATGTFQPANTILTGLAGMGTNTGLVAQNGAASFLKRTLQANSPIVISNGDGVAGDPTFGGDIASDAEAIAGTDTSKIIVPSSLAAVLATITEGSWAAIGTSAPSAAASVTFTGLSAYRYLRVSFRLSPATDGVNFLLRTSTDNGSSYDAGVADYGVQFVHVKTTVFTASASTSSAMNINSTNGVGNSTNEFISGQVIIYDFNQATQCTFDSACHFIDTGTQFNRTLNAGVRTSTTARNALQLIFSSGNVASGHVVLEGIAG